jgi:hypothetical protein
MSALLVRRIAFSGLGAGLCIMAWKSYLQLGLDAQTAVSAVLGIVLLVAAITAKGG